MGVLGVTPLEGFMVWVFVVLAFVVVMRSKCRNQEDVKVNKSYLK